MPAAKMKVSDIDQKTLMRLQVLAQPNENADDVVNRLVDSTLGFGCPHTDQAIYMEAVYDEKGYVDIGKTLTCLDNLRFSRPTTGLIRVCKQCLRGMKIKY